MCGVFYSKKNKVLSGVLCEFSIANAGLSILSNLTTGKLKQHPLWDHYQMKMNIEWRVVIEIRKVIHQIAGIDQRN
jgi:hypothetical protein